MNARRTSGISRRRILSSVAGGAAALTLGGQVFADADQIPANTANVPAIHNGRIKQTVCRWCYAKIPLDELCSAAARFGFKGIDLVKPDEFATIKKYNLVGSMVSSHTIPKGLNRKENWEECLGLIRKGIEAASAEGWPNVICFSGNRAGMDNDEGMKNCSDALKQIVGFAEQKKVTVCMELLNSKVNHPDYMCDHSTWGVGLVKRVGSERFKLLYDIYHMQIMEGDVIATIKKHKDSFAHYHTGGVPGRHEIDETQELYYPAVIRAIVDTGYTGWLGQEFIPAREPLASLAQGGRICDV
jgi:hydroxypyruvate isomerase